jgi:hypothetical protein
MKRHYILFYVVSYVLLLSCEPTIDPIMRFKIEQGDHYATPQLVESMQRTMLVVDAKFNESARYDLKDPALQTNKNKLIGFADCNATHHDNSARFAWQWHNNALEIYAYCYVAGERQEEFIGTVELGEYNRYSIKLEEDAYAFQLNDGEVVRMKRGKGCTTGVYYKLWPYFGGSVPAPHMISIDIKPVF